VADPVLEAMRTRRVTRTFLDEPVSVDELRRIVRAAHQSSGAGGRQIRRFLVIRDPARIEKIRAFAPGILRVPPALIVLSNDRGLALEANVRFDRDPSVWIDVGTALSNMMLAAQALGLGSCPATSFSQAAVAEMLGFPDSLVPALMLQVGRPAPEARRFSGGAKRLTADELTDWEEIGQPEPTGE
jgi:albonoursin synthase